MSSDRQTSIRMGVNKNSSTGEYVQWINFRVPSGEYAILLSDVGWKAGASVLVDNTHAILVSAVYPVTRRADGIGLYWKDAIRDSDHIDQIIKECPESRVDLT